jgi:two-component system, chemotaxis family, sensor kinase CheA
MECDDILKEFIVEACEALDSMDRDLVALEQQPGSTRILGQVFRTIHTIKGSSGFLALPKLESIAHVGENLLSLLRDGKRALDAEATSALLAMADAIREIIGNLESAQSEGTTDYQELVTHLAALTHTEPATAAAPTVVPDAGPTPTTEPRAPAPAVEAPRPVAATATAAGPAAAATGGDGARSSAAESSIRVDVRLLDTLMNLVGELVLARNQILQFTSTQDDSNFVSTSQRLNLVTTELQEGVMKTRMQPVGSIWTKFPRVVRDLAISCGKRVRIEMEGEETELDKTIVESIKDPLTHAIRNSVDHGIEAAQLRRERGKPEEGCIQLRAFHEGGMVNIEIADDGGGIDTAKVRDRAVRTGLVTAERAARMSERELIHLITLPGFSTAERVTNVSGRGVGMDVVKTNIEKIGGTIDIQSVLGKGTTLKIKIPLTLAIIPALIVTSQGERYAIPQVNLLELVRLEGKGPEDHIEYIHGAPVHRLRGNLLPLLYLDQELGKRERRGAADGGARDGAVANIVVLQADDRQFGLVVESILDTEEIVVKPLGRQLKAIRKFAGAAIMGDGLIALILDVMGLAQEASIISERQRAAVAAAVVEDRKTASSKEALLLIQAGGKVRAAIELPMVARLEEFDRAKLEHTAGQEVVQYRDEIMPIVRLAEVLAGPGAADGRGDPADKLQVVVVNSGSGRRVGLVVDRILDIIEVELHIVRHTARAGIRGAATVQGLVTDLLDVQSILRETVQGFLEPAATAAEVG